MIRLLRTEIERRGGSYAARWEGVVSLDARGTEYRDDSDGVNEIRKR
jgi:hypothetical protein